MLCKNFSLRLRTFVPTLHNCAYTLCPTFVRQNVSTLRWRARAIVSDSDSLLNDCVT